MVVRGASSVGRAAVGAVVLVVLAVSSLLSSAEVLGLAGSARIAQVGDAVA